MGSVQPFGGYKRAWPEFRHQLTRTGAEREARGGGIPKHQSSKDTKRWCKGRVGREHDFQWGAPLGTMRSLGRLDGMAYSERRCVHCRRAAPGESLLGLWPKGRLGPAF